VELDEFWSFVGNYAGRLQLSHCTELTWT
jgi:hypothetical protein